MFKGQTLKALVIERLTAAAEEIFALFEKTATEYEEELRRFKEENTRNRLLLDDRGPRVHLQRAESQIPSISPGSSQTMKMIETLQNKEEQKERNVKLEEEQQLLMPVPEFLLCVKTEEHEHREEIPKNEPERQSEQFSVTDEDLEPLFSCLATQVKTNGPNSEQSPKGKSAPVTSVSVNSKTKDYLRGHAGVPTGENANSCSICNRTFTSKSYLRLHTRTHTGEKPYNCSLCKKTFAHKCALDVHTRRHRGERPFRCSVCQKCFSTRGNVQRHERIHSGEKPYCCTICSKRFNDSSNHKAHMYLHEKTFYCTFCSKAFSNKGNLMSHMCHFHS